MSGLQRRASLGMFLRRSKSGNLRHQATKDQELQRQRDASVTKSPPRLPQLYNGESAPQINIPGSEEIGLDSVAITSGNADYHRPINFSTPRPLMDPARYVVSVPPRPAAAPDPYARTESMTHRGRYSYASSAISTINSPRRVRRKKDPTPFNVLIIGTRGSGKTSFLEFLKTALALPARKRTKSTVDAQGQFVPKAPPSGNFVPHYLETEINHERIGLTLWDSEGLEKNVVDLQLREMSAFLESKFEETFIEEMKVVRSPGVQDTHIHAVFLVLDPARLDRNISANKGLASDNGQKNGSTYHAPPHLLGGLDEDLDLQVVRTLQGKTTVIPVISKADTVTTKHMNVLKKTVWDSLKQAKLDPLEVLGLEDEDTPDSSRIKEGGEDAEAEETELNGEDTRVEGAEAADQPASLPRSSVSKKLSGGSVCQHKENKDEDIPYIPMSILSPDLFEPGMVGRQFPWGFANPFDETHCDFARLKETVFSEWRAELREASKDKWYEGWRTSRLNRRDGIKIARR